jgi:hypothetical protein
MLRLKSLKEPTILRILIARYRSRYLPKDNESWDLAPSKALGVGENLLKTRAWAGTNMKESSDVK